jgi:methionyl-tRNA synthetase
MEKVDTDTVLNWLTESVEKKRQISSEEWMNCAMRLVLFLSYEDDDLIEKEQEVAKLKLSLLHTQDKRNVAAVELEVESTDTYKAMRKQRLRVDRINEYIRLAKKYASINDFK